MARAAHFNKIFKPLLIIASLYFARHVIDKILNPEKSIYNLITAVLVLLILITWRIVNWRSPIHAPKMVLVYGLTHCIFTNLAVREQLPIWLNTDDKNTLNDTIFTTLVVCHCMNYNTMIVTFFIQGPIFLISYYFQLLQQQDIWFDPFEGTPLDTDEKKSNYLIGRLVIMIVFIFLTSSHHYMTQLDMSIIVLEKNII